MKNYRLIVVFLILLVLPSFSYAEEHGAIPNSYPDLLEDEASEEDFFDESTTVVIYDPLEPINRAFFTFNDAAYEWIIQPVTEGYMWFFPRSLRECFGNVFYNLAMPVRLLNSILQGDLESTGIVLERFLINSTLGVYGIIDVAYLEFDISPRRADFGQTLGKWGIGEGIYICWPIVGPSTIRDSIGLVVDAYTHPIPYFHDSRTLDAAYYISNTVNTLSLNPDIYDDIKKYSLDPYVASRQAYYEYRKVFVKYE
jgi:phospholipid-binding lipoprotein MlaA